MYAREQQSWTKLLRKLHSWGEGGIFSKLRIRPILPSPLPLEAVLLGPQRNLDP